MMWQIVNADLAIPLVAVFIVGILFGAVIALLIFKL